MAWRLEALEKPIFQIAQIDKALGNLVLGLEDSSSMKYHCTPTFRASRRMGANIDHPGAQRHVVVDIG
jgi:hypothetical protein